MMVSRLLILMLILVSCNTRPVLREMRTTDELMNSSLNGLVIKTHMKDGTVYILNNWLINEQDNQIVGFGKYLNIKRELVDSRDKIKRDQPFLIDIEQIALAESNDTGTNLGSGLTVMTGITATIGLLCLTNPKACFGSCPTFYAETADTVKILAEGFSTSILPSLEKNDIDMLFEAKYQKDFSLTVTNEALETHSIRHANLLVFEKEEDQKVFASNGGKFYKTKNFIAPSDCQSINGDCKTLLSAVDYQEYFSLSDEKDLNKKEEILISFYNPDSNNKGLVIGKRQTIMTTYLLYQALAYMGKSATFFLSQYELGNIERRLDMFSLLGGIEVYYQDQNADWIFAGEVMETGPIALDFNLLALPNLPTGLVNIKLILNQGLWRIDYAVLAELMYEVTPTVIKPFAASNLRGQELNPLGKLLDDDFYLVTYPGDKYVLNYQLPFDHAEIFLDSKGYYLEWIRTDWIKEQNFRKLNQMVNNPKGYLKRVAKAYKKAEPLMEETFWSSRYVY